MPRVLLILGRVSRLSCVSHVQVISAISCQVGCVCVCVYVCVLQALWYRVLLLFGSISSISVCLCWLLLPPLLVTV